VPTVIGATTVGTGGDYALVSLLPNFLAVVFKKQDISQQVVTRMQDLASEFSKKFSGGNTPEPSERDPAPNTQPRCWDPNLGPFNFSAVVAPLPTVKGSPGCRHRYNGQ